MTVYASNIYVSGSVSGMPMYTNTLATNGLSNIIATSDMHVDGNVSTSGRVDTTSSMYATFRLTSNQSFAAAPEITPSSNAYFQYDGTAGDLTTMLTVPLVLPNPNDFNDFSAGWITVPASGLYSLSIQGSFSNNPSFPTPKNGVYFRFLSCANSNSRIAAVFSPHELVCSGITTYLLAGDKVQPIYYTNDSNASLLATNGETFVGFTVNHLMTPDLTRFVRI